LAESLDAEAALFAGEWAISVALGIDGEIDVAVVAGMQPVLGARVTLLMSGQDAPTEVETDIAGLAHATMPIAPGVMTVVASTSSPGLAAVYRGSPAGPDPQGAQRLVTGGPPRILSATATVDVPIPTTTTTMIPPETTTTTTVPPETTTTTTIPPETTTTTTPIVAPLTEVLPPVPVPVPAPGPPLPKTGKGSELISYLGTSMLVAGIGIVGVASRRGRGLTVSKTVTM
jgi:LPXTG-motif cell wall-anchored protein